MQPADAAAARAAAARHRAVGRRRSALLLEATDALKRARATATVDRAVRRPRAPSRRRTTSSLVGDRRQDVQPAAAATVPVQPQLPRARHPAADEGRREGDRLRRPVHRAERRPRRRQRAHRGRSRGAATSCWPTTEVGEAGATNIFGGGDGLAYSRATPAQLATTRNDADGVIRRLLVRAPRASSRSRSRRRGSRTGTRVATPPGETRAWIDFAGPPASVRATRASSTSLRGRVPAAAVRGQGRRRRRHGAVAPGPPRDLDDRERLMPGPEIHAQRDHHRARAASRCATAPRLARRAARRRARRRGAVRGAAAADRPARVALGVVAHRGAARRRAARLRRASSDRRRRLPAARRRRRARRAPARSTASPSRSSGPTRATRSRASSPSRWSTRCCQDADGVRLGGVRGEATVMFSDLRGFTTLRRDARAGAGHRRRSTAT